MHRSKNGNRVKPPSSFKMEIGSRKNSLEEPKPLNRRLHVHSSLLHAQRNIKLLTKNLEKRHNPQPQDESLPKLKKEARRNHSTLDKDPHNNRTFDRDSYQESSYLLEDTISKEFMTLKSLLNNVKDSKRKEREQAMNLLGLEIKRIEPQSQPQYREVTDTNITNISTRHHSSSMLQVDEGLHESRLVLHEDDEEEKEIYTKTAHTFKKKTHSLPPSDVKYEYYHNKVSKQFKFSLGSEGYKIYERRLKVYREFIFAIQLGHNVYLDCGDKEVENTNGLYLRNEDKYKVWIGAGNNWMLIKSLMKRRYWWAIMEDRNLKQLNFVWTQIKVNALFERQNPSSTQSQVFLLQKSAPEEGSEEEKKRPDSLVKKVDKRSSENLNPELYQKILNDEDRILLRKYVEKHLAREKKSQGQMQYRHKHILKGRVQLGRLGDTIVHNHLENNFFLGNKKAMFYNMKQYYELVHDNVFNYLPLTFHIRHGTSDIQYKRFQQYYKRRAAYIAKQQKEQERNRREESDQQETPRKDKKRLRNIWIVKPGELSNRGNGITVIDELYEIEAMLNKKEKHGNGAPKTLIVQLYIDRPLLYNNRKFDIRHYMLVTNMFGVMRGYWYQEGYIRTASYEFDVFTFDKQIHLTNDAVQKHTPLYGKYEQGNKLSYSDLQRYLDAKYPKKDLNFENKILPKMKQVATDAVKSAYLKLSPENKENNFEIFGLDFMIDADFKPWLIEINTNPCLELSSSLLERIIPTMVEHSLRLSLDVMFPPPGHYPNTSKHLVPDLSLQNLKYDLIFDSLSEGLEVRRLYKDVRIEKLMDEIGAISDEEEEFDDNGEEIRLDEV